MKTLYLDASNPAHIEKACNLLWAKELVALPTETVYGLAGLAEETMAFQIFEAKGRPLHNPLIVHVGTKEEIPNLCDLTKLPQKNQTWLEKAMSFWPGPLTLVLPKKPHISPVITANLDQVAIRIPSHPVIRQILLTLQQPLIAPSANLSNRPSPTKASDVLKTLDGRIAAVLDAGPCAHGLESTVLDISHDTPMILRLGALGHAALENILQTSIQALNPGEKRQNAASPGLLTKHYAPLGKKIYLAKNTQIKTFSNTKEPVSYMILENTDFSPKPSDFVYKMPNNPIAYGQVLYQTLYEIEGNPSSELIIETPPNTPPWAPIWDRLIRASTSY